MVEVEVTFEYVAEQEDELTIKVGDILKNVTMSEGGWWEGELSGKVGMFPDNFVKVIEKPKPAKVKEDPPLAARKEINKHRGASVRELASKIKDDVHVGMGAPKKKESQPSVKRKKAKVLFSYEPENEDELKLDVGNIVEILKQDEEGWWEGSVNGKTGMFPSNFVEEIEEIEPEKTPEEKPKEAPVEGKKKLIGGVGLGNIFEGGPIKLKTTSVKNTDKVSHPPPDPVVRHTEEETKPHPVTKREKPGVHDLTPIPAPRPSQACSPTPQPRTYYTSDSYPGDKGSHNSDKSSQESSHTDLEGREGVEAQDSWVNILFSEQGSDDENDNREVQFERLVTDDVIQEGEEISNQYPSYTIRCGLDKLSLMQLTQTKDLTEETLIEYADVEVDEENKENMMSGRCVSAIASLGSGGSRTSVLVSGRHNTSNNNNIHISNNTELKSHSKSVNSLKLNTSMEKQNLDNSVYNTRVGSWLSDDHQSPTGSATSVAAVSGRKKESLFKRVIKLDMFRKRSKSVMPYNGKDTEGKQTEICKRQIPSLTELCRNKLTPDCPDPVRTPLKEITSSHVNEEQDPDQLGCFEVSVDSLDRVVGSEEAATKKKTNAIPEMFSEDSESLLTIIMNRDDLNNEEVICNKDEDGVGGQCSDIQNIAKGLALEGDLYNPARDDHRDKIARDSYLGSLNRTGQLSPFIRMIASRYHLFDPVTQKWKEGYMDGPEYLDLSESSSPDYLTQGSLSPNSAVSQQASPCPVPLVATCSQVPQVENDQHHKASPMLPSYNILPPGSVKEKVFLYEHLYVNELVDQVIERTMHGLCVEQCLEELGKSGHHPELCRQLMMEYSQYSEGTIPASQRSEGEISPQGSEVELSPEGSVGEVITSKGSDGEISSECEDGCIQSSEMCQSQIEYSLCSAITDVVMDTDYATAMSDMDTDGSYVVSTLSNADLNTSLPEPEDRGQTPVGFNASGEYVDLPEQLIHCSGYYNHSHPAVKPCDNPVLLHQKNMDGPWVSPVHTRLRMGTGACPRTDTFPLTQDSQDLYTQSCSIGTQTPDIVGRPTTVDNTPTNRSTISYGLGVSGHTEDRASSPIKELLSYDTTLEDSWNTSDLLGSPAKVKERPRYSSSPIKTFVVEEDKRGKRKLEDVSYKHGKVHCSDAWLTRNHSLPRRDRSNHSLASRSSSLDVNTEETFNVHDCTEKRRKRFSWKKMFQSKVKEPVVLISYRKRSDQELEEDLIKGPLILNEEGKDVSMESGRTKPLNSGNHALYVNQVHQDHPSIFYRTKPFSEDLNTVETFFSHDQDEPHSLDQCRTQGPDILIQDRVQLSQAALEEEEGDESDGEQYSLCDMEIDEEEEQARIERVRDTKGHCGQCDLSDLHIHGQGMMSQSTAHSDILDPSKEAWRAGPSGLNQKSLPDEDSDDEGDSEGVSLDSPNISPSLAIAIRNNMVATPESPEINLDSFLQEALRPIDDLLEESAEGVDLEEEITPRIDSHVLHPYTSELPEKYPGFTYISPSMENILAMYEDESPYESQYIQKGQGDVLAAKDSCQAETDTSSLSLEYVLCLERKFQEELGSELEFTPQNTPLNTPQHTPREDNVERYPSFTFVGEEVSQAGCFGEVSLDCCDREAGKSNLSSSAEGLYDYGEDTFESSDSEEEKEARTVTEKRNVYVPVDDSEEIEEVIEVDCPLHQSTNDSLGLDIQSFLDGTKSEESYLVFDSDTERVPSFITEYVNIPPTDHHTDMLGACALPTLEDQVQNLERGDNQDSMDPDSRGRSSYCFLGPSTEVIEDNGLSDSGLLLSFSSSPDSSSSTINV
ncbi:uncharacterized protein LOC110454287 isoform X2 [Mizuhopecten yessoensis]|uniref:uncharacterized protein LOC110454287 isoform X2 n=1 Tax=Mizuhopecten yessoensis TaxID=6573 RepID=UPI000B45A46C|nr:uncharacterized protein LOC110454287 isoform X2 [Mizuhopecten yessoensis]